MNYNECRNTYHNFYYHNYTIVDNNDGTLTIKYDFEIEGLSKFEPTFTIAKSKNADAIIQTKLFKDAAFSLGMVELISYWKIACPLKVTIACGYLDAYQLAWWKKLYFHGLGEFFYMNHIPLDYDGFMDIQSTGQPISGTSYDYPVAGNLIPVGGGKDSFVTLDLLKEMKKENCAFIINPVISAVNSAHAAGYQEGKDLLIARRTLDQRMLDLNAKGYLNGHTPFSAMAAFASYLTAVLYQRKYITLSNESSANESTIKDSTVNHQYSKTFEFEQDFNDYCGRYLYNHIHYFSLLRPLSELQITGFFSMLKPYHNVFRSCNVGSKKGVWCGHCAKCLFVCIMLSGYLPQNQIIEVFGKDMLNDPQMRELFEQLTGILDDKPFECVGTRDEVNIAICMAISHMKEDGDEIPLLYQEYMNTSYYDVYRNQTVDYLAFQTENHLPSQYVQLLQQRQKELHHAKLDK